MSTNKYSGFNPSHKWINSALQGDLKTAYSIYNTGASRKLFLLFSFRSLSSALSFIPVLLSKRELSTDDLDVDLASEFILFWKRSDFVGIWVLFKILRFYFQTGKAPSRALLWYAHWLGFQGKTNQAEKIFTNIISELNESHRHLGEAYSFYGNLLASHNRFLESKSLHIKANHIFKKHDDLFFQIFNLGISSKTFLLSDSTDNLKKQILSAYDELNPEEPDRRYGMRVLIYMAFLYCLEGDTEKGYIYKCSAESIYHCSASPIDRSSFCIYSSIIYFLNRDQQKAFIWLKRAKQELKEFGTYKYYENTINDLDRYYKGKQHRPNPIIKKVQNYSQSNTRIFIENWHKDLLDNFNNLSVAKSMDDIIALIEQVALSEKVEVAKVDVSDLETIISDTKCTNNHSFNVLCYVNKEIYKHSF